MIFKKNISRCVLYAKKNKLVVIAFLVLFLLHLFFRFSELEKRAQFTWDQVDNAWHAKNMIVDHIFPLNGMPAQQNNSVTIGPFYYYFVALFYLATGLDPIAAPIIAGIVSIVSFLVLFMVAKKMFNVQVALIAVFLHTFSFYIITLDRVQWPVALIPAISLLIFFSVMQIVKGNTKYFFILAVILGLSFHIHFTSVFYLVMLLFCLPLFPRTKKAIVSALLSLPIFIVWLIPFFISISQKNSSFGVFNFINENYIGLHLRRVFQVADTVFLESQLMLGAVFPSVVKYLPLPIFAIVIFLVKRKKAALELYVIAVWILVPWISLATYKGTITPYYFSSSRFLVLIAISYIVYRAIIFRKVIFLPLFVIAAIVFMYTNVVSYQNYKIEGLSKIKDVTYSKFKRSTGNEFMYGSGETYLYYYYEHKYYGKK